MKIKRPFGKKETTNCEQEKMAIETQTYLFFLKWLQWPLFQVLVITGMTNKHIQMTYVTMHLGD